MSDFKAGSSVHVAGHLLPTPADESTGMKLAHSRLNRQSLRAFPGRPMIERSADVRLESSYSVRRARSAAAP